MAAQVQRGQTLRPDSPKEAQAESCLGHVCGSARGTVWQSPFGLRRGERFVCVLAACQRPGRLNRARPVQQERFIGDAGGRAAVRFVGAATTGTLRAAAVQGWQLTRPDGVFLLGWRSCLHCHELLVSLPPELAGVWWSLTTTRARARDTAAGGVTAAAQQPATSWAWQGSQSSSRFAFPFLERRRALADLVRLRRSARSGLAGPPCCEQSHTVDCAYW